MAIYSIALDKKYDNYSVFAYDIIIGGSKLSKSEYPVIEINTHSTLETSTMNDCEFTVFVGYDYEKHGFDKDIYSIFQMGKQVEVKLGYGSTLKGVFNGYINSVGCNFSESGIVVRVQCLDAKGVLKNKYEWSAKEDPNDIDLIKGVLQRCCSMYGAIDMSGVDESQKKKVKVDRIVQKQDALSYLIKYAKSYGYTFCTFYKKIYFGKFTVAEAKSIPGVSLSWGKNLLSFQHEADLTNQIGTVKVIGYNKKREKVEGKCSKLSGKGKSGSELAAVAKDKTIILEEIEAENASIANQLARGVLSRSAGKFVHCQGRIIGLPEVCIGSKITIEQTLKGINGDYILSEVTHSFSGQGYITEFKATSSKLFL